MQETMADDRRLIRRVGLALLLVCVMTGGLAGDAEGQVVGQSGADEVIDRVLAVAAGDLIMLSDVRAARELGLVPTPAAAASSAASDLGSERAVLSALIDRALVLDEVNRFAPPEPSLAAVDLAFTDVRDRVGSLAALDVVLARGGLDQRQLREMLRQNLRIRAYLDQRFSDDTPARAQAAIAEWTAGLRRRADIVDLYQTAR